MSSYIENGGKCGLLTLLALFVLRGVGEEKEGSSR